MDGHFRPRVTTTNCTGRIRSSNSTIEQNRNGGLGIQFTGVERDASHASEQEAKESMVYIQEKVDQSTDARLNDCSVMRVVS
jgi:hypothetical protein